MTITYEEVKKRLIDIKFTPRKYALGNKPSQKEIEEAEEKLGNKFPGSYKQYLMDFCHSSINGTSILIIGKNLSNGDDILYNAFNEWEGFKPYYYIPKYFIPFSNDGFGNFFCFDTRNFVDGECPVVYYLHEEFPNYVNKELTPSIAYPNFAEFLNEAIDVYLRETER